MEPTANLKMFLSVRTSLRVYKVARREIFVRPERATEMTLARSRSQEGRFRSLECLSSRIAHVRQFQANCLQRAVCGFKRAYYHSKRLYPLRLADDISPRSRYLNFSIISSVFLRFEIISMTRLSSANNVSKMLKNVSKRAIQNRYQERCVKQKEKKDVTCLNSCIFFFLFFFLLRESAILVGLKRGSVSVNYRRHASAKLG